MPCELLAEAAAANTTRSYAATLRYWAGLYQARIGVVLTLLVSEAARPLRYMTKRRYSRHILNPKSGVIWVLAKGSNCGEIENRKYLFCNKSLPNRGNSKYFIIKKFIKILLFFNQKLV